MSPVIRSGATQKTAGATSGADFVKAASAKRTEASSEKIRRKKVAGATSIVRKELPQFSRQLSAMLAAGMPIVASLQALEEQTSNPNFKPVITSVRQNIENGLAFSEALKGFPTIFDHLYVNMIRGGESGGQLAETISRIADFQENSAKLRRKVKSAMSYPVAVMCIALLLCTGMLIFIVPVFKDMFESLGGQLPGPTQFLVTLSNAIRNNILIVAPTVVVIVVAFNKWKKTPKADFLLSKFYLKMPIIGELVQKVAMARFARTFAQLIHSGVPILTALEITAGSTGNRVIEKAVMEGAETVEKGEPLSSALGSKSCFTPILVHMMAAGEKTGKVDEMMDNIAAFYEDEVDTMLSGLTSLIEPLLMVFLGATVGGIVVCMFLPIFKMHELIT